MAEPKQYTQIFGFFFLLEQVHFEKKKLATILCPCNLIEEKYFRVTIHKLVLKAQLCLLVINLLI